MAKTPLLPHVALAALSALALLAAPALAQDAQPTQRPAQAAPSGEPIRIGVAGPMSGPFEVLGKQIALGAKTAVDDINAAGGVLDRPLVLEVGDDQCDRQRADAEANRMIGRGIAFMAGHLCSQPSIEAARVYAENDVVMISPAATHPDFTDLDLGPGVFRLAGRDDMQGEVLGQMLASRFANDTIAILHDGNDYGQPVAETTRRAMNTAGKIERLFEGFDPQEVDFEELVARLRAFGVKVVFVGARHRTVGLLAQEMNRQNLDATIVAGDALATEQYADFAGHVAEGTLIAFQPDPVDLPEATELVGRLTRGDNPPEGFVIPTYAAVQTWAEAVETAGSLDFDAVVEALQTGTFPTVMGDISFDTLGDAEIPSFEIYVWRQGAWRRG